MSARPNVGARGEAATKEKNQIDRRGTEFAEFGAFNNKIFPSAHSASPW